VDNAAVGRLARLQDAFFRNSPSASSAAPTMAADP
jgi:hypothetical protein